MKNFLKKDIRHLVVFGFLMILLIIPTLKPVFVITFGQEVYLEVTGYDPSDPFRGDYVNLGYTESFIPVELFDETIDTADYGEHMRNETVYVSLEKSGDYYHVSEVSLTKPEGLFLRAEFEYMEYNWEKDNEEPIAMFVNYELDRIYVPENTGLDLEREVQQGNAYSVIKVYNGRAVLTDVLLK